MGKVTFNITMSLDGFVAGPDDSVEQIFKWLFSGDTEFAYPSSPYTFKVSRASAERMASIAGTIGSIVTGRRTFDVAGAWDGNPPLGVPHIVMTHRVPQEWVKNGSPFTFVTDGIEHAIEKARQIAGGKDVVLSTPTTMQQALKAGLLDEINIDLAHILLGEGIRLFENLGAQPVDLEITQVVEGTGVTHLTFRVVK